MPSRPKAGEIDWINDDRGWTPSCGDIDGEHRVSTVVQRDARKQTCLPPQTSTPNPTSQFMMAVIPSLCYKTGSPPYSRVGAPAVVATWETRSRRHAHIPAQASFLFSPITDRDSKTCGPSQHCTSTHHNHHLHSRDDLSSAHRAPLSKSTVTVDATTGHPLDALRISHSFLPISPISRESHSLIGHLLAGEQGHE